MNNNIKISLTIHLEGSILVRKNHEEDFTSKPATQHLNMNVDSYNYMQSKECPAWIKHKDWFKLNAKQRLETHLLRISQHLGGTSFTYEILED